jgi:adenylate cyclase class 2
MQSLETEIKFRVHDRAALEKQLTAIGFRLVTPSTFECNTLYDTADRALRAQHQILRIRQYGDKWVVTHKRLPAPDTEQVLHKHRIETESAVEDGEALASIFIFLGLKPVFSYEKWRTEYADPEGHCVIDQTPIGLFAELEGPTQWIDSTATTLGIAENAIMTLSYGRLFEQWKAETGSTAQNLTFADITT